MIICPGCYVDYMNLAIVNQTQDIIRICPECNCIIYKKEGCIKTTNLATFMEKRGLPDTFMSSYHFFTSQFDDDTKKLLHDNVLAVMRTANNFELIFNCSASKNEEWLSEKEAYVMVDAIVKNWTYKDFLNFFNHRFSCTEDLRLLIAKYAFSLILESHLGCG